MMSIVLAGALLMTAANPATQADGELDLRCGSYCLFLCLNALGEGDLKFAELERQLGQPTANGYSMGQLAELAQKRGFHTLGVVTNTDHLLARDRPFACIARIDDAHFVTLANIDDGTARIFDPPRTYDLPLDTLRARWDGTALLISPAPLLAEEDLPSGSGTGQVAWVLPLIVVGTAVAAVFLRRRAALRKALVVLFAVPIAPHLGCGQVPQQSRAPVGPVVFFS